MTTETFDLEAIEEMLEGMVTIPTVPSTLMEINKILDDPDSSARDAADVVAKDPAVATKTLRLVNSAYYALQNPVSSIPFAVSILGLKVLKNLVIQATVLDSFGEADGVGGISGDWLWDHSFKAAVAAGKLAELASDKALMIPEDAYTCGLIHDVGRIIMGESLGPKYARAMLQAKRTKTPIDRVERELFKFDHAMVGAVLSESWRLSPRISKAILHHHNPEELEKDDEADDRNLGHLLHVANTFAHTCTPDKAPYPVATECQASMDLLGLTDEEALAEIRDKVESTQREM